MRGYGFLVLVALAQLPGYALAAYGVEPWGRRPTLIGFLLLQCRRLPALSASARRRRSSRLRCC